MTIRFILFEENNGKVSTITRKPLMFYVLGKNFLQIHINITHNVAI